jgi:hypothetical protein
MGLPHCLMARHSPIKSPCIDPYPLRKKTMRKFIVALILFVLPTGLYAQDAQPDSVGAWTKSAVGSAFLTQAQYDNWTGGGENATAFKAGLDVKAESSGSKIKQTHTFEFAFGQSKIGDVGFRKVDDLIHYALTLTYPFEGKYLRPVLLTIDARTQLASGFDYGADPEAGTLISKFFTPGYITATTGLEYNPGAWYKARFGVAVKQTIVGDAALRDPEHPSFALTNGYGNNPDQSMRLEAGFDFQALVEKPVWENVLLKSELNVFSSFSNFGNPDVRWKNLLAFKINEYLNANFDFELFYDEDQSSDLQLRQVLSLGLSYTFL